MVCELALIKPTALREVIFEGIDSEIFKIPDTRTRLETLQNCSKGGTNDKSNLQTKCPQ